MILRPHFFEGHAPEASFSGVLILLAVLILGLVSCVSSHHKPTAQTVVHPAFADQPFNWTIHFPTNGDRVVIRERRLLDENVRILKDNGEAVVIIEGYCDERGPKDYNLKLGDRRARAVKSYLLTNGVNPRQLVGVVSYGEDRPVDKRHNNYAWRKNRRVEFKLR